MNVAAKTEADHKALSLAMALSLTIGLLMFVMKVGAYLLTGSAASYCDTYLVFLKRVVCLHTLVHADDNFVRGKFLSG